MTPDNALRQAHMTAHDYASYCLGYLCDMLDVDRQREGWQAKLAPFAGVWAAMIRTSAQDFDTAMKGRMIDGYREAAE